MTTLQRVICGIASLLIAVIIIDLVRRRRLREEYALLWLAACAAMILIAIHGKIVDWFAGLLGIQHAAYSIFVIAILIGMALAIHFTLVLSKLTAQNWRLIQEVGLLKTRLEGIEADIRGAGSSGCGD